MIERAHDWVVGDPLDAASRIGPLIEKAHLKKVLAHIKKAQKEGARLVHGGKQVMTKSGGYFVEPTIFDDVTRMLNARISANTIFPKVSLSAIADGCDKYQSYVLLLILDLQKLGIPLNSICSPSVRVSPILKFPVS